MKGEKILKILEFIEEGAVAFSDFITVFLSAGYGASLSKFEYELSKLHRERTRKQFKKEKDKEKKALERQMQQRFYNMIARLKRDNLIEAKIKNNATFLQLTKKGKKRLKILRKEKKEKLPIPSYKNSKTDNKNKFIIVIFDIPETERRKRDWLRAVLKNLGLKLIQKSVWIGKIKLPKEFMEDLRKLRIINFVEIFEINKTGTLE